MSLGTALVLIFLDPTVDVFQEIARRIGVSAFYISFVLAPICSNATEVVCAYNLAKKRTVKSMTTTLSLLVGAAIMNNTFCLGIFLGLIYFQQLAWEFTAETICIVLVEIVVGILVYTRDHQRLLDAFLVLGLYPCSIALVWLLEREVGVD